MDQKPHDDLAGYDALKIKIKTGDEHFHSKGRLLDTTLLDFWRWSSSDLVNNTLRGKLAEYLVTQALGIASSLRTEWDSFDLMTSTGLQIEVKSAAYLQSWYHKKLSSISFGIRPTLGWDAAVG
ncbi:hypothetical protein [Spirosoma pollinicola]|uniref:Uncharacterized protein n=1 Tax=Spirosoma pollinicola TaxID=2057025 RepID=A0A2K8Z2J7_9BACT|nr:hypothetical protein [Spirosoma pollinicola]AUD04054.1 hypothetical protein CWM47_20810 [Spirosoma pollinicola]